MVVTTTKKTKMTITETTRKDNKHRRNKILTITKKTLKTKITETTKNQMKTSSAIMIRTA